MSMDLASKLMSDPEIMALMQKPGVMAKLQQIMANPNDPALLSQLVQGDPDMMKILQKLQGIGGAGGGMPPGGAFPGAAAPQQQGGAPASASDIVEVRDKAHFDSLLSSSPSLVVVDFTASWCGPCKRIAPAFASLSAAYAGRAVFLKVDGDRCRDVTAARGVSSYPTFHFYRGGSLVASFSGANEAELRRLVELHSAAAEAPCPYRHFPLRDGESVAYRACKFDKVRELVAREAGGASAVTDEEMKELNALAGVLEDTASYHQSEVTDAQVVAVERLLAWPADKAAPGLHYARMLALHPSGAAALARRVAGSSGGGPDDLVARLGGLAAAAAKPAFAMLALRALSNFFARRVLARELGRRAEDLFNALAPLSEEADPKVRSAYVVLLLNFTILLRDLPELAEHKVQVLSTVAELLGQPCDSSALYSLLVVLGSLVYRDADTAEMAAGFELGEAAAAAAAAVSPADPKVSECAAEVARALADPSA